jgi:zinc/manganese transport system permease protein
MMIGFLVGPFVEFDFMRRALVGCLALSLGAPPIGVFLMLRRMSLMGDAMSHAILPGVAIGYLIAGFSLSAMSAGGLIAGLSVAFLAGAVSRSTVLKEDASLAAFYLISLASGVLIVSARGSNVDLMQVLFGTVLSLDNKSLLLIGAIATISMIGLAIIYRPLVMECIDAQFLRSVSRSSSAVHLCFLALVVLSLVGSFNALGTLMAVGIMLLPAATARFWAEELFQLIVFAVIFALASCYIGLLLSYHLDMASGPTIIITCGAGYVLSMLLGPRGGLLSRLIPLRHLDA